MEACGCSWGGGLKMYTNEVGCVLRGNREIAQRRFIRMYIGVAVSQIVRWSNGEGREETILPRLTEK